MIWGAMVYVHYRQRVIIDEYKGVVAKQDSMIKEMSFSNDLVKEYFDIKEDSSTHQKTYVLKSNKSGKIIEREYVRIKTEFLWDDKEISADELIEKFNANESEKEEIINDLVNHCNSWIHKYNETNIEKKVLQDSLQMQRMAFGLLKKNYGIDYIGEIKEPSISVHLLCDQVDSAFILLDLYRDKMNYDSEKKVWVIQR